MNRKGTERRGGENVYEDYFGIGKVLYCTAFALYVFQAFISRTEIIDILLVDSDECKFYIMMAAFNLLILKAVLYQRVGILRTIAGTALIVLGFVTWITSGSNLFLWMAAFVACGKNIKIRSLAWVSICVHLPGFVIVVWMSMSGFIENYVLERGEFLRFSMGFSNPNSFALMLFDICLAICVIRFGKRPGWEIGVIALSAYLSYRISISRTFTAALILMAALYLIFWFARSRAIRRVIASVLMAAAAVIIIFSMYSMANYSLHDAWMVSFDEMMSSRISMAHDIFTEYPLTYWGRNYSEAEAIYDGTRYLKFIVDNSYCSVILRYGIVAAAVLFSGIAAVYANALWKVNWGVCLLGISIFIIIGFSETMMIRVEDNYFLIAIAGILYQTPADNLCIPEKNQRKSKKIKENGLRDPER